jgi:dTDP-4-dehydrorhamnose 3,5-epimerase
MKFLECPLAGGFVIELESQRDERGFFARSFCADEFQAHGLCGMFIQINVAFNEKAGTLRGMHFQSAPHEEVKLVSCTRGAVHDVMIDLRAGSPTHSQTFALELTADNGRALYVPAGFAHGYQTLTAGAQIQYLTSQRYAPGHASGVRFDDPAFELQWPLPVAVISEADRTWPDYRPGAGRGSAA